MIWNYIREIMRGVIHIMMYVTYNMIVSGCDNRYSRASMAMTSNIVNQETYEDQFDMDDLALALSNTTRFDSDSIPVKIDNCCTQSMSGFEQDFMIGTLKRVTNDEHVYGFADSKTPITHRGTIIWKVTDDEGIERDICIPNSYYVPNCNARLLSPQHWAQELNDNFPKHDGTWCATYKDRVILYWKQQQIKKTIYLSTSRNNVATMWTAGGTRKFDIFRKVVNNATITYEAATTSDDAIVPEQYDDSKTWDIMESVQHEGDESLSIGGMSQDYMHKDASKELLEWHLRLGHIPMSRLQVLASEGVLPSRLAKCGIPICAGCMYGKMGRKPWRTKANPHTITDDDNIVVGDCVSVDQLVSSVPGLLGQIKGIPTRLRYRIATIFVDHASDYTFVFLQTDSTSAQTLLAKKEFERHAAGIGIHIKRYHADNGRFVDNAWTMHAKEMNQQMTLCGVNAHHQNGRVEKRIRDLQDLSRSSILHALNLWPDAITINLWPYALRKSAHDLNHIKRKGTDKSPMERFSGTDIMFNIKYFHTFGCPMYVLTNTGNNMSPKWKTRARLAVYVGNSMNHASSVGLALSLDTGLVSPVFHAKYDDTFQTVVDSYGKYVTRSQWQLKCGFQKGIAREVWLDPEPAKTEQTNVTTNADERRSNTIEYGFDTNAEHPSNAELDTVAVPQDVTENTIEDTTNLQTSISAPVVTTRSGRQHRRPTYLNDYIVYESTVNGDDEDAFIDNRDPISIMLTGNQDNFYYHEILREPDVKEFVAAMHAEINDHNTNGNWLPILRNTLPAGIKVIPSVWAMRRKRKLTDGKVYKWKARLNVDGSKQIKGVNFWETYAPVAQWISIRLILCMSSICKWKMKTFDFVQAFPQAPSEAELYVDVPRGCTIDGDNSKWCLKVLNNIYGQKQAGRVWYRFMTEKLINQLGYTQSKYDPCVLWKSGCIIVIYTDDTIITGPDEDTIDMLIAEVGKIFKITSNDSVEDFLGVNVRTDNNGQIILTQPKLIDSILEDLGLNDQSTTKRTPAISSKILLPHLDSPSFNEKWHYRSVIGKLNFLEKSTRPDIAYAVHQCARFASNPRYEHGKAVKHIGRYLLETRSKGIQCNPTTEPVECFADADFAGNWDVHTAGEDRNTARSRTGYIIKYASMPISWASKLQTEVALSSTESEYIALSTALREVLPMINFLEELIEAGFEFNLCGSKIYCKAFEDNEGALEMARSPKFRPRTKHINIKYHHFHDSIDSKKILMEAIDTLDQQADIMTKPVEETLFVRLRKRIHGW